MDSLVLLGLRKRIDESLRSSGGRPALAGTTRRQKVPLSEADYRALATLAAELGEETHPVTAGQVAGQLLHEAIASIRAAETPAYASGSGQPPAPLLVSDRHAPAKRRSRDAADPAAVAATMAGWVKSLKIERRKGGVIRIELPADAALGLAWIAQGIGQQISSSASNK